MLKEFREFAIRGSVIDLAVGVIIGTAFGKIVTSVVNDLIMPIFGILLGNINLSTLAWTIGGSEIKYGAFLQAIIDFLIVAYCIFLFVKQLQRFRKQKEDVKSTKSEDVQLLMEIRDLLKKNEQ